jgi:hypothetical protein
VRDARGERADPGELLRLDELGLATSCLAKACRTFFRMSKTLFSGLST